MTLALEDFTAELSTHAPRRSGNAAAAGVDGSGAEAADADRSAGYEQGYSAGWEDAVRAAAEDQARIGADFARSLQELSFTFHEARAQLVRSLDPLLTGLTETFLPALVAETLGARLVEEIAQLADTAAAVALEIVVAPESRAALEPHLTATNIPGIQIVEEPSLTAGQVFVRLGKTERQIDLDSALDRLRGAIRALYDQNERTQKHG